MPGSLTSEDDGCLAHDGLDHVIQIQKNQRNTMANTTNHIFQDIPALWLITIILLYVFFNVTFPFSNELVMSSFNLMDLLISEPIFKPRFFNMATFWPMESMSSLFCDSSDSKYDSLCLADVVGAGS